MSTRRHFIGQSAAAASALAFPLVGGAQPKPVKVGVLHPVTGALAYSGQQCRMGAMMAIEDINKAGGIKSLGGAKIEALLADDPQETGIVLLELTKPFGFVRAGVAVFLLPFGVEATLAQGLQEGLGLGVVEDHALGGEFGAQAGIELLDIGALQNRGGVEILGDNIAQIGRQPLPGATIGQEPEPVPHMVGARKILSNFMHLGKVDAGQWIF